MDDNDSIHRKTLDTQNQCIIQIVKDLQPQIHYIAFFIRTLKWQENKNYTILLLCLCILLQHLYKPVLFLFPIICLCVLHYLIKRQPKCHNQSSLLEDLTDIRNNVYLIVKWKTWIQNNYTLSQTYMNYSIGSSRRHRAFALSIASSMFGIVYAGWVILLKHLYLSYTLWSLGFLTLFVHSPWFSPIKHAFIHALNPIIHFCTQKIKDSSAQSTKPAENQLKDNRVYCFEVYHHQRWWFPAGWSRLLLPQDPSVWSDAHLESTPSIFNFTLPPPAFIKKTDDTSSFQKHISWVWVDSEWTTVKDDTTDSDGWQYGNWQWKNWGPQSGKLGICTRRRKWYRYAQRIERVIDVVPEEQDSSLSECETCTLDSLSDKWENKSGVESSCSHSTTIADTNKQSPFYYNLNTIVLFDNKGEKMLRR